MQQSTRSCSQCTGSKYLETDLNAEIDSLFKLLLGKRLRLLIIHNTLVFSCRANGPFQFFHAELMALSNFFHETKADSAYDKGPVWYFDAYRLTNKGGTSYQHFFDSIYIFVRN